MRNILKSRFLILLLSLTLLFQGYDTPNDIRINKILKQLELFRTLYKQQKVHLHTDKDVYLSPENIWIKAYLVEASTFLADSISKEIYVDLIDFNNKHIQSIIIRNRNGFGQGNILLSDTLIEGNYQLRAYTNWMRNFDENFFFSKTILIKNPNYENSITNTRLQDIKRFNKKQKRAEDKITVQFFPEGGNLVEGFESKIAFKIENGISQGVSATGIVFANKIKIVDFETMHDGMGYFMIKPEADKKYTCQITHSGGKTNTYELPIVLKKGIILKVDPLNTDKIKLSVFSNRDISQNIASNEIIIIAQSRGVVLYVSKGEVKNKTIQAEIPKSLFPAGVAHITLIDARNEPLCERLLFIDPKTEPDQTSVNINKTLRNDSSIYSISINKPDINISGNISVSVRELLPDENPSYRASILSNLLLTSDIKGRVNNPWYYFSNDPDAAKHLDLVMLTNGWRRFVWKTVLNSHLPKVTHEPSLGISIGGKITKDFFEIPVPNAKVKLTIKSSYNDVFETTADEKGRFLFSNLDYEDTVDIQIEAFKPNGGKGVQILIGDTIVPDISTQTAFIPLVENFPKQKLKANRKRERMEFKKNYKEREPDNQMMKIHQTPNDVLYVGDDVSNYSNILQYMQGRVPGVSITGNRAIIRGVNTFYGSTDPLFLLDGIPIDPSSVGMINPQDIAIIEVLKGPEASIYGSRGANGVIAFFTRRGKFMKRGIIDFGMLGYQKVREFYVPAYDTWNYKPQDFNVPRTICWKPELRTDTTGITTFTYKNNYTNIPLYLTIEGLTNTGDVIWFESVDH